MTIVVGAISRNHRPLPEWLRQGLVRNLSRHAGDVAEVFGADRWLLAKVDIGVLGGKGSFGSPNGSALVIAGEPLIANGFANGVSREAECQAIYEDMCRGQNRLLAASTGTFCGAFYSHQDHCLTLFADKLGVRPIYYIITPEFAAFSSALRVFEAIGLGVSAVDLRGVHETCTFGFPLGDRTCYEGVRAIGPSELVHIRDDAETHAKYFAWDQLQATEVAEIALIEQLVAKFEGAVKRRLRNDKATISHLSGGLDSRAIVAALRNNGVDVVTINFAPAGTQDRVFGALAAEALGTMHHQVDIQSSQFSKSHPVDHPSHYMQDISSLTQKVSRPFCVWSGNGGSVGLGHVYLDRATVDACANDDLDAAVRSFLNYNRIAGASNKAMNDVFREATRDWHIEGALQELKALHPSRDGRAAHLFLMFNDQRRHLVRYFEDIDLDRFEFHLPFYDADVLETIIRAPIRPFLRHELYVKWLELLSSAAVSVPWQAYPGHVPCPIPYEGDLRYQWNDYFAEEKERRQFRAQRKEALQRLFSPSFPNHLINRGRFAAAVLCSYFGSTAFSHILRVGNTFARYWQRSKLEAPNKESPPDLTLPDSR